MATPPDFRGAEIHDRVLRTVERVARHTGARRELVDAIGLALEPLAQSVWPDVAWRFSRLTAGGHPVEFGVSTQEDRLRVTLEVAGPECPDETRLDVALGLLARLGLPVPDAAVVAGWKALQSTAALRWGCWLGLRQSDAGYAAKIYVETPGTTSRRMIGHDAASGRTETYFALPMTDPRETAFRLRAMGVADSRGRLEALAGVVGVPLVEMLRRAPLGVSVSDEGEEAALFLDSDRVAGAAELIRRRMNAASGGLYGQVFDRPGPAPGFGVVSVAPRAGAYEIRAGLPGDAIP